MELGKDLGLAGARKISRTCTQDYVPIKDIVDGVVITSDNRYIKILEITPANFMMKSPDEQEQILASYEGWLKAAPRSFQIKCMTKQTQVSNYVDSLQTSIEKEESSRCREIATDHINFLKTQGRFGSVERHFYLIFEYEPENEFFRKTDREEIFYVLQRTTDAIKSDFSAMENDILESVNHDADIAEFLYDYYNKGATTRYPFDSRVNRIIRDSCIVNKIEDEALLPPVDVRDLVAPRSIDTTHAGYMLVNGMYRSHFYIESNGYPNYISPTGWLAALLAFGNGFDTDLFFQKESTIDMLSTIRTRLKFTNLKYNDRTETSKDRNIIENSLDSMRYLMSALENGQSLYNMSALITIHAYTFEELVKKKNFLIDESLKMNLSIGECSKFQEEAFFAAGPYNNLSDKLYSLSHQNLTSRAVAAAYPYTNFALTDKRGIMLGTHQQNRSLVMYDPFDAEKYANANITIFGQSGKGKTYALLCITSRLRYAGVQVFILSPDKQDEFRRICDEVDGLFVDVAPGSTQRINPFDIWPKVSVDNELLNGENYIEKAWLSEKVDNMKLWFQHLIPDITPSEKVILTKAMLSMYKKRGITEDNDSIFTDASKTKKKEMPIISDLLDELKAIPSLREDIPIVLSQFVDGAASYLNGQTNVDLDNKYVVFGLEGLSGDLQAPIMYLVLEYIWSIARANRTKKKVICIDEGWKLRDPNNPQVEEFVIETSRIIRGFGGGSIFASQSMRDTFDGGSNFGNAILSCSHSTILLGMSKNELEFVSEQLGLSPAEQASIRKYKKGEALLCAGPNHIPIKISASQREHQAFTTQRSDLAKIVQEKRKESNL